MDFLIDECVFGKTKELLEKLGFSIISIVELGKAFCVNGEVIDLAKQQESILITNDLHFSDIALYPIGSHLGIIVLRLRTSEVNEEMEKVHIVLTRLLKEVKLSELKGTLIIVDRNKYRIHKG